MIHMLKAWPSILARESLLAREQLLIPAFERYFAEDGHLEGSMLVQKRHEHNTSHGLRGRDVAATEVGQMVASVTNSVASAFWMVYYIFSSRAVLEECRAEVEKLVQVDESSGVRTVDLAEVKTLCPVLFSTWQETLRYVHIGISARVAIEDIMLDGKYLLKKGATVMTAYPVQHSDASVWGPTVGQFDHRRFVREPGSGGKRKPPNSFRPFGGGAVLCPGRHFVTTEVMAFAALLLLRFDLRPMIKDGKWADPGKEFPMTSSMPTPKDKLQVEIVPRTRRVKWRVEFGTTDKTTDS